MRVGDLSNYGKLSLKLPKIYRQTADLTTLLRIRRPQQDLFAASDSRLCEQKQAALRQPIPGLHVTRLLPSCALPNESSTSLYIIHNSQWLDDPMEIAGAFNFFPLT